MHFDSFGHGILTVFEVSSGEMWPDIMYNTVDAVGIAEPMLPNYNQQVAWYYIFVQIVIAFLMLNVFVGVVIEEYEKKCERAQENNNTGSRPVSQHNISPNSPKETREEVTVFMRPDSVGVGVGAAGGNGSPIVVES